MYVKYRKSVTMRVGAPIQNIWIVHRIEFEILQPTTIVTNEQPICRRQQFELAHTCTILCFR